MYTVYTQHTLVKKKFLIKITINSQVLQCANFIISSWSNLNFMLVPSLFKNLITFLTTFTDFHEAMTSKYGNVDLVQMKICPIAFRLYFIYP